MVEMETDAGAGGAGVDEKQARQPCGVAIAQLGEVEVQVDEGGLLG